MIEGLTTTLVVARLQQHGYGDLATDLVADFKQLQAERDKARAIACDFEGQLHRLNNLYLALKEQGGGLHPEKPRPRARAL